MKASALATPLLAFVAAISSIVIAVRLVLRAPRIPYNVRELFLDHASLSALVFFALAIVWIGAGAMLLAHVLCRSRRGYVLMPLAVVVISLLSKMLLSRSVTYESIDDIIGSNNLFGLVTQNNLWGSAWHAAFRTLGPDIVDFVERRVRYTALYSIPLLGLTLVFLLTPRLPEPLARRTPLDRWLLIGAAAVWLWLARTVVITWAATDNLTELVAVHPVFGIAGEWYLFAIPVVIGICVVQWLRAVDQPGWTPAAIASTIVALLAGWLLLNAGLEPHVEKYGYVFSGAQFLLGPNRSQALPGWVLFARWAALQSGAVAVTFAGAWIARSVIALSSDAAVTSRSRRAADAAS